MIKRIRDENCETENACSSCRGYAGHSSSEDEHTFHAEESSRRLCRRVDWFAEAKEQALYLARKRRLVPILAAGTTQQIFGSWDDLCQALWTAASGSCPVLGEASGEVMSDVERVRVNLGDVWVTQFVAGHLDKCLQATMMSEGGCGESSLDTWTLTTPSLELQRTVGKANFRMVVTTNFDRCLELSGDTFRDRQFFRRDLRGADLESRLAHGPTPLLKIHGDVTLLGSSEMVMGYEGHRKFAPELAPLKPLLQRYGASCLFYGASLRANANWAQILDVLFGDAGSRGDNEVHYLVTADAGLNGSSHATWLWKRYRIRAICFSDWVEAHGFMMRICCTSSRTA